MNLDDSKLQKQKTIAPAIVGRIDTYPELNLCLTHKSVNNHVFQKLDLTKHEEQLLKIEINQSTFLGCTMSKNLKNHLEKNNYIISEFNVPFEAFPSQLYDKDTLYNNYDYNNPDSYSKTLDKIVYDRYYSFGAISDNLGEMLARTLHDYSIRTSKYEFLDNYDQKKVVAIMGGHKLERNSNFYKQIAYLSKTLTEKGYLMVSGGGPGAMEATHLGAWFADKPNSHLDNAISILSVAPVYNHELWLPSAFKVFDEYPTTNYKSLSIPTWFYGHEPPAPFSTHIAKLFENSLREEGLLSIAKGGVIYAPGSAGTMQEIFQDLAQNHYESYGHSSPMIFCGEEYWTKQVPIYPFLKSLIENKRLNPAVDISVHSHNHSIVDYLEKK